LRLERFTPKAIAPAVRTDAFDVVLAQSGVTLTVPPEKTVLDALLQNGIDVDYCCSEGTCGSCETAVLEGQIDHRCSVLSDEERAAQHLMMVCVSRSAGQRLILDL
jgi:ferredoxin